MFRKLKKKFTPKMIAEAMGMEVGEDSPDACVQCGSQRAMGSSLCERCAGGTRRGAPAFESDNPPEGVDPNEWAAMMPHERTKLRKFLAKKKGDVLNAGG